MNTESHDAVRERLDDYVDEALDPAGRAAVEAHLAGCPACAAETAGLRKLLGRTEALPPGIEPARDLWPEIRDRLRPASAPAHRSWWRAPGALAPRLGLAGAAAALVAAVWFGARDRDPAAPADRAAAAPGDAGALAAVVQAMEVQCRGAGKELWAVLRERPGTHGAEAAVAVAVHLDVLDRAIAETRAALDRDPGNRRLLAFLAERYQRKLTLLQEAAQLAAHV
jgi:anti-sigma factor RsiW